MERHEASFEIDSKQDSYAARRIVEQLYDTVREEMRGTRDDSPEASEVLREFETLREAGKQPTPGKLTITYDRYDDEFEN